MPEDDSTKRLRKALASDQRRQQAGGLSELADIAEDTPEPVIDLVPLVATYLDDSSRSVRQDATVVLGHVAEAYPAQVKPAVPQLTDAIESGDIPLAATFALGQVAKSYPLVAKPLIDTFLKLLCDEDDMVRNNALASLADLADKYPDELHHDSPRYIELLVDDDKQVRYNATSILARIAKQYPEDVAPAIPYPRNLLDVDHTWTRENVCWALSYLCAEEALEDLKQVRETDPDESVRNVAEHAVYRIQR